MADHYHSLLSKWRGRRTAVTADQLFLCGLERETMRVQNDCWISKSPHPQAAGSPLTHPFITTDFAESLLEFTTPPFANAEALIRFLEGTHAFVAEILNRQNEQMWPFSMPPAMDNIEKTEIAKYGDSYAGRLRHIYRRGLALRYGKRMQTIAGIHFNFSFRPAFFDLHRELSGKTLSPNQLYFHLMRNYLRIIWVINYLFGASPALDNSFLDGTAPPSFLRPFGKRTLARPHSSCLRMSSLGYVNQNTKIMKICFNSLEHYLEAVGKMLGEEDPRYAAAGIKGADGEYQQLNANILQIENEYYASVRPKSTRTSEKKTIDMLREHGVEYVEIRNLDIDPFLPAGIGVRHIRFLQLLMTYCVLKDSPPIDTDECERITHTETQITQNNLEPDKRFIFIKDQKPTSVKQATEHFLDELSPLAEIMDQTGPQNNTKPYSESLASVRSRSEDPSRHPAKQLMHMIRTDKLEFLEAGILLKDRHKKYYDSFPQDPALREKLPAEARHSLQEEKKLLALHPRNNPADFDRFIQNYVAHTGGGDKDENNTAAATGRDSQARA